VVWKEPGTQATPVSSGGHLAVAGDPVGISLGLLAVITTVAYGQRLMLTPSLSVGSATTAIF
jgi:hypothetical protein